MTKLDRLAADYGYETVMDMLETAMMDGVCPGVCTNKGCTYSTEVEPDCTSGYCEVCGTQTVKSGMVLAGVI